jgi:hypothetical protein
MSFNGSGTFLINSTGQPVVANTVISATVFNALTADLASGLTNCITKDGQSTPTANIPMGNNKVTGLAAGTLANDAANLGQVQSTAAKLITISGTDTITGTMSPTLTAYAAGQLFYFVAGGANTGAVTLNVDGLGSRAVTRDGSTALAAGDINSGEMVVVIYDGTRFQMINAANSFGNTTINGTLTVTGNTTLGANVSIASALAVGGKADLPNVSAALMVAAVGIITDLRASGASISSANVGTAIVTNLTATGASVASVNANVALLTTATVTNLTATGASIASANIGNLALSGISVASANFGVAVVTDLRVDGASITSANVGTAVITTGTFTNLTATGASVASANAGVANVTDLRAVSASVTSANLGTAVITNGTVTNLIATSASVASVNAAVALVTTGTVTNLTSTAASIASANLGTAVITTLTATGASVASANVGVAATTTLTAVQASIGSANLLTARFLGATSGYVGIQGATNAGSTTYTLPSADGTSGQVLSTNGTGTLSWTSAGGGGTGDVVGPASATDNAVARFDLTTGKLIQNSSVIVDDSGSITGVASLAAVTASITSANAGTAVITTGNLTFSSTAQRITGDFSNATHSNRLLFQNSGTNLPTIVGALPSGTSVTSGFFAYGGSTAADTAGASIVLNGGTDARISSSILGTGSYLPMTFYTGGSERVRIDTSGNVGIGTASPATTLHLKGSFSSGCVRAETTGSLASNSVYNFFAYYDTGGQAAYVGYGGVANSFDIVNAQASGFLTFKTGGYTERMRIDSSGNVGIGGTAQPQDKVGIEGVLPTSSNSSAGYAIRGTVPSGSTTGANAFISRLTTAAASFTSGEFRHFYANPATKGAGSTITNQYGFLAESTLTDATNNYGFYSNIASGSNRWNFYAAGTASNYMAGRLGIGMSPESYSSYRASIQAASGANACLLLNDTAGITTEFIWNNATSGDNIFVQFGTDGGATLRGSIDYNRGGGLVRYNTTSDYRAKTIIGSVTNSGELVDALKVYVGKMNGATVERPMLIAHEAQEVAPYAVSGEKDAVDKDGKPVYQQIDVSSLVPLLIAEVKSLRQRVAELEAK